MPDLVYPRFKHPTRRTSAAWRKVSKVVESRAKGLCEANIESVCPDGKHRGEHCHHVILRSQGGPDETWNLLYVCHLAHNWIHANPAESARLGFIRRHTEAV